MSPFTQFDNQLLIEYYDNIRDPIKTYFSEKIQIVLSSKCAIEHLNRETEDQENNARIANEERVSMGTKKELRSKQMEFNFKVSTQNDEGEREKSISKIMEKHQKLHDNINAHFKKELDNQETEFEKKMERRRERSVSRSMNKSVDKSPNIARISEFGRDGNSVGGLLSALKNSDQKPIKPIQNPFKDGE